MTPLSRATRLLACTLMIATLAGHESTTHVHTVECLRPEVREYAASGVDDTLEQLRDLLAQLNELTHHHTERLESAAQASETVERDAMADYYHGIHGALVIK